jgi:RimJ/RimL family protein N-acetyltransferase
MQMSSMRDRLPAELVTERLVLATPTLTHVPEMAVLANNRAIYEVLARLPHPYGESDGQFFVEHIARGPEEFAWSILHENRFIGVVGLNILPDALPELGYWLGKPHWGQGFATEASTAVVAAARQAGYPALRSRALLSNHGSRGVLRKLGFIETGEAIDQAGTLEGRTLMTMRLDFVR